MAKIPTGSVLAREAAKGAARSGGVAIPEGSKARAEKLRPGDTWVNPLQEQHPDVNRFFLMNFESATPETMGRALAKDFEVKHRGGLNFSIRKPGEKKWRVVDPDTWSDWIPFWGGGSDWGDILGDLFVGITSGIGGTIGFGGGTAAAPGAGSLAGASAGAAAGAAAGEAAKQAVGKLLGGGATAGEALESVATEAVLGGVAEPLARVAAPAGKKLIEKGKTALLGNTADVAGRNQELLQQYARDLADAKLVDAPIPEGTGIKEQVKQGFLDPQEALAQVPPDSKIARWLEGQITQGKKTPRPQVYEDIPEPTLEKPVQGLLPRLTGRGEKLADELLMADTQSMADLANLSREELAQRAIGQGVRTTEDVTPAQILKGADEEILLKKAENVKAGKQRIRQAELDLAKAEALAKRARGRAEREAWKAEIPVLKDNVAFLKKQMAKEGGLFTGVEIPSRMGYQDAFELAQKIQKGEPDAIARAAELGVPIEEKSQTKLARDLFDATATEEQKGAIGRQVDEALEGLEPYEEVKLSHILRNKSKDTGLPAGAERTAMVSDAPRVDREAYRRVQEEVQDLSLEEAQDRLVRSGWEGEVPTTKEGVVDALHARREWGKTHGEVPEGFNRPEMRRMWSKGPRTKPHTFAKPTVTSIERGGETFVPGQRPSRLADIAKAARIPEIMQTTGKIAQGIGSGLQRPKKIVQGIAERVTGSPHAAEVITNRPAMSVATLGLAAVGSSPIAGIIAGVAGAEMLGSGIHKVGRFLARDGSGRTLIRIASSAPERIARKMTGVIEALEKGGLRSYRAGIFSLMHDPEVRYWMEGEVKKAQEQVADF